MIGMNDKNTIPVRKGEELNLELLERYLRENLSDLPNGSLQVKQFPSGLSNLTYALKIREWEAVLRRPPLGPVPPKAHDMKRESDILKKVNSAFSLAPKPLLFSEDESIIGGQFFVMERRHGFVLDKGIPSDLTLSENDFKQISETMVDTLVALHEIDYEAVGLDDIGHPDGFMERQVQGWIKRYNRAKTNEISGVTKLTEWLVGSLPKSDRPTLIHYDFKLNNVLFSRADPTELTGIFDWEMSTIGDPLADLGVAMSYWAQPDDPDILKYGQGSPAMTIQPGFMTRDEFIDMYARKSGRDVSNIHYYLTFAYFKLAVICQQIYYRWKQGQTSDPRFAELDSYVYGLIELAIMETKKGENM